MPDNPLVLHQLLAGRDFATTNPIARNMQNFVYLIGSRQSHECLLVDPAWDIGGLVDLAEREGFRVVGGLLTHYHPDHVGGDLFGHHIEGVAELLARTKAKLYVNEHEADGIIQVTGASPSDLIRVASGHTIDLDGVRVELLHTPGHTPGSQCFYVNEQALVSGDTLFIGGCGRTDLPGGNDEELYQSLNQRLARLPGTTMLYPGHDYGAVPCRPLGEERKRNAALLAPTVELWRRMLGAGRS